jgi:hypothetical protein
MVHECYSLINLVLLLFKDNLTIRFYMVVMDLVVNELMSNRKLFMLYYFERWKYIVVEFKKCNMA